MEKYKEFFSGMIFTFGDNLEISKYKLIFPKGYSLNWTWEMFMIKDVTEDINAEEIIGTFYEN